MCNYLKNLRKVYLNKCSSNHGNLETDLILIDKNVAMIIYRCYWNFKRNNQDKSKNKQTKK